MLFFDIESDGLLDTITKIHSLVIVDEEDNLFSYADQEGYLPIADGIRKLSSESCIVAHNGLGFDVPAILKVTGIEYKGRVIDTVNFSRLVYPQIEVQDTIIWRTLAKKLMGKHSLEAWGQRLKFPKSDFKTDWKAWSKEMQDYCEQDVRVLKKLYEHLASKGFSDESIDLEMGFQKIINRQEAEGFPFNVEEAQRVDKFLNEEKERLSSELKKYVEFHIKEELFIPKKDNKARGYIAGKPVIKIIKSPFNYNSRLQIVWYFKGKGWKPIEFTDKNNVKLDADVLREIPFPEAELFAKYFDVVKIQGRVSQGESAWLRKVSPDGRVHGTMITNGAVTGRGTHSIISNIPRPDKYLGKEVRSMFLPPKGMVQVGCDAKAIELRNLAHYLYPYDGGKFAKTVCEGDVHTENQKMAELPTRDNAKTFIYCFLYGGGASKIGQITHPLESNEVKEYYGKQLKQKFLSNFPALSRLIYSVKDAAKRGYLVGLDGRKLEVRSQHSALNTLLQSAGAIIMKRATIIAWQDLAKFEYGKDVVQLIHYHDEYQFGVRPDIAEEVGMILAEAIAKAGEYYKFKCPLAGDYKIGANWYECH